MVAKKRNRGGMGGKDAEEDLNRVRLQAILLADTFATLFRPITLERPKVLLPLVNWRMIDYTLEWLQDAGVEEVFVICCAHSNQVIDYLEKSVWFGQPNFSVTTIKANNSRSAGDALRLIYENNVICGDFVLVTGDTVSNMSLKQALKAHKERKKKDNNAIMTMAIKQSKPSPKTRQTFFGTEELFIAIDQDTKQLLHYGDNTDKGLLINNSSDCYIDICSQEVLSLFIDNFDYQHLRRDFVKGLLVDDIMGYKIFTHDIGSSYAARVENYRSYETISKDIILGWTYPYVPDFQFSENCVTRPGREGSSYRASDVELSRSAKIGCYTSIGSGTRIGNYTEVSNSVIGEGCIIGSNVSIDGCYIWDKVTIENGCRLKHAIVCDGVIMKSGAVLEAGVVLSFKVIIGEQFVVPAYSKVSLLQQPVKQDSDEELECADNNSGNMGIASISNTHEDFEDESETELSDSQIKAMSEVGNGGVGFIWLVNGDEWRHSVAPIPEDRLVEIIKSATDKLEISNEDGNYVLPPSVELELSSNGSDSDDTDDYVYFQKEVEATFLRAVHENVKEDHVILEVNSLRLSCNLTSAHCASALFFAMMKLALDTPHGSPGQLLKNVASVVLKWSKCLKYYLASIDDEIEVIQKFEEMCLETTEEYTTHFAEILHLLYDKDILREEAILNWASEKENAVDGDKFFVKQAAKFIQWLNEASEEESD